MSKIGSKANIFGPEYAINDPSGDHTGFRPIVLVSRTGDPPPVGILNSPLPFPSSPPVTIQRPSGDQSAEPSTSNAGAISLESVPSAEINRSRRLPLRRVTTAIRVPSGEIAAGSAKLCAAPHTSVDRSPSLRHNLSPVPTEDR